MLAAEAFAPLVNRWRDEVVISSLGTSAHTWWRLTQSDRVFYMLSSMGLASSLGLGLSLSLPQARVWVLNSDGSLVMNFGTLLTEAQQQPDNLVHFVLSNACYDTIGGHSLVNGRTDFAAIARAAGIRRAFTFRTPEEIEAGMDEVVSGGYALAVLEVEVQVPRESAEVPFEGPEMKYRFGRNLERQFGHSVFGPSGY